ncbi:MAG: helix-turn-helix domain-containing protein [Patescibacteria group bacterium]
MKKEIKELLSSLDLNPIEARVFMASLEIGSGPASTISESAGLNRVTTYEALKRLSKKGFIKIRAKKNSSVKYFVPEDIDIIKEKLENKKDELTETIKKVDEFQDEFRAFFTVNEDKPTVLFFGGKEGIKSVLQDTLKQKPKEILSFASGESLEEGFEDKFLENYWKKRVNLSIPTRGILPSNTKFETRLHPERNKKELRELKFISPDLFKFKNEIDIYGDNVGITSHAKGNEHGIVIRSKSIAESMKSVFEVLWLQN